MPRWPEKDKTEDHPEDNVAAVDPSDTNMLVRSLSERVDDLNIAFMHLSDKLAEIRVLEDALKTGTSEPTPIVRRRDEIELRRALKTLASGQPRPKDDESEQIISDCIGELFAMRQLNHDLMHSLTSAYQHGLASVRKLTER